MSRSRAPLVLIFALTMAVGCHSRELADAVGADLQQIVSTQQLDAVPARAWSDVAAFYEKRTGAPAWINAGRGYANPRATEALELIHTAPSHGLDGDYGSAAILALHDRLDKLEQDSPDRAHALAEFEARVTASLLHFARDVAVGRTKPASIDPRWKSRRAEPDLAGTLADVPGTLAEWLDQVRPQHDQYVRLQAALATAGAAQRRLIALNMERWRWMPDDLGDRHFLVNLPDFLLRAVENGRTTLEMKVVVGKPGNETPIFSDEMETIVFSPYWNIPDGIAEDETAPAIAKDLDFIRRNNLEVLRVSNKRSQPVDPADIDWEDPRAVKEISLRQKPGSNNALGLVKFLFPNPYDVYLHDTPADRLFERRTRAFSHGCMRVEQPEALAQYVLRDAPEWTPERITKAMHAGDEQHVKLKQNIPVHIAYFTASVNEDGTLRVQPDVYGYDRKQSTK